MKPALYYTLASDYGFTYKVIAVTSEKPGRMIYGRDLDGMSTHCKWSSAHGRFPTAEAATERISKILEIDAAFAKDRKPHERALAQLNILHRDAIKLVIALPNSAEEAAA